MNPVLTPSERRMVAGVARGRTIPQIARDLHLDPENVRVGLRSAGARLGARRQHAVVDQAYRTGNLAHLPPEPRPAVHITHERHLVLHLLATDRTIPNIARHIELSVHAVRQHSRILHAQFEAVGRAHLVALAHQSGHLTQIPEELEGILPPARPDTAVPPSARQLQILEGIARGRSDAQIASDLGMAVCTVSKQVWRAGRTLGAGSRAHLLDLCYRRGHLAASPAQPTPEVKLSRREQQVLEAIAEGLTNEEIGHCLHLSTDTVKSVVRRLLHKLQATSRSHAVALAHQHRHLTRQQT